MREEVEPLADELGEVDRAIKLALRDPETRRQVRKLLRSRVAAELRRAQHRVGMPADDGPPQSTSRYQSMDQGGLIG